MPGRRHTLCQWLGKELRLRGLWTPFLWSGQSQLMETRRELSECCEGAPGSEHQLSGPGLAESAETQGALRALGAQWLQLKSKRLNSAISTMFSRLASSRWISRLSQWKMISISAHKANLLRNVLHQVAKGMHFSYKDQHPNFPGLPLKCMKNSRTHGIIIRIFGIKKGTIPNIKWGY